MAYRICEKTEGTIRYVRCKVAAYYGGEHQRADWNMHKENCMAKDGGKQ
jgi:hypothetical protein